MPKTQIFPNLFYEAGQMDQNITAEEEREIREISAIFEKIYDLLSETHTKRETEWENFQNLLAESKNDPELWEKPSFQSKVLALCQMIDCRVLGEDTWESLGEIELMAQAWIRNIDENSEQPEEVSLWDSDFCLQPDLFEIPLENFEIISPMEVLGLFVLLDRYIDYYSNFLKKYDYEMTFYEFPQTQDGEQILSKIRD